MRAERAHLQRLNRKLQIIHRAGRRGEVQDVVDRARHVDKFGDVMLHHREIGDCRARWRTFARVPVTRLSIDEHFPAVREQIVAQVRSKKSGTAGDYCAQGFVLSLA